MKLTAIRKGKPYSKRCQPHGCIQKPAPCDGLLIETDEGDEVVPAAVVQAELDKLKKPKRHDNFLLVQERMAREGRSAQEIRAAVAKMRG